MSSQFADDVVEVLRKNGVDQTKPLLMEFFLSVPRKDYADHVLKKLRDCGFSATASRVRKRWELAASRSLIPSAENIADHGRFFEELARATGGEFNGWESELGARKT